MSYSPLLPYLCLVLSSLLFSSFFSSFPLLRSHVLSHYILPHSIMPNPPTPIHHQSKPDLSTPHTTQICEARAAYPNCGGQGEVPRCSCGDVAGELFGRVTAVWEQLYGC
jgi:hypothetical protein